MKIGLLIANTTHNRQRSSWGGISEHIAQTLEKHGGEVSVIAPSATKVRAARLLGKIVHHLARVFLKKQYLYNHTFLLARTSARAAAQQLAKRSVDVIVAPCGATEMALLPTAIPIVLIEDANIASLHQYYAGYSNLLRSSFRQTDELERLAIGKARLVLQPSQWAARRTIERYHADAHKVHVVPFGANIAALPPLEVIRRKRRSDRCSLFFLGVDWERKGGDIAVETLEKLEELGIQAELVVCGCTPPHTRTHPRMRVIPFLNKRDERQRQELERLFETSDFLFLPTRSECYGIVFCEAAAFGLPVIATDTGGVSGVVRDGENGFLLPLEARGAEYADLIARLYRDEQRYTELVRSSRAAFEERLNWDAWGSRATQLMREMLESEKGSCLYTCGQ